MPERCSFFLTNKNRKCRMLVRNKQKFCGEHAIYDENNEERVACPNDPKHTVKKSSMQKHLMYRCNSRLRDYPWIVENLNVAGSSNEIELGYRPTVDELLKMRDAIIRIHDKITGSIKDSYLLNTDIENHGVHASKRDKKHIQQISSIIEHLNFAGLLNNDERWCIVEFGAGKALLSYWLAKTAPKCRLLLIEKKGSRNKFDSKARKDIDSLSLERIICSVEHLDLSKIEMVQNVNYIVAVCKHLCGSATDFGIRCLLNGARSGLNIRGFALVPCCHHRTTYKEYFGRAFLEAHDICSANEFATLRHISTWAVCGFCNQTHHGNCVSSHLPDFENLSDQKARSDFLINSTEKELLGQKAN